jgi:hypothetical protein
MSGTKKSHAALLDELATPDSPQRREVAAALRSVAETFAGVPPPVLVAGLGPQMLRLAGELADGTALGAQPWT